MFAFSFTVFVSLFQLLPVAPYRVLDIGGSTAVAGLFLGLLTYSSALSAPFTGAITDRIGQRRVLIVVSLILAVCSTSYAFITNYAVMLTVVVIHGLFWSGLLSASSAYMTATIPESRRAEGLGYWGLASVTAIAIAPALGLWVYHRGGWMLMCGEIIALNLVMAIIAWRLPDDRTTRHEGPASGGSFVEWKVVLLSITLGLVAFGYGGLTSFASLFADHLGVTPSTLFLTAMASTILLGRLTFGRKLDQIGHRRMFLTVMGAPALGLLALSLAQGRMSVLGSGLLFGAGFGLMYPAYAAYVIRHVASHRRGAAFGAIIAAFDTGVGTGSSALGGLIQHFGYRAAFATAAGLAALSVPYFLFAEDKLGYKKD
jgi:MFS family permease